jgi:hypothetical protein
MGSQLRKEGTSYDAHVECRGRTLLSVSAKKHVVLSLVATVVAALAIVPNGLGSDAIGVDQAGWVEKVVPDFALTSLSGKSLQAL